MGMAEARYERFSRSQIQERIDAMWKYLFPRDYPDTWMYPVKRIADEFVLRGRIEIITNQTLPRTELGGKIWGKISRNSNEQPRHTIYIDRGLQSLERRATATLAHEIGHLVLHWKILKAGKTLSTKPFSPTSYQAWKFKEKSLFSEREWIEWHADEFMSALILPKEGLQDRVIQIQKSLGILNPGLLWLDHQPCNQIDVGRIIAQIASDTMIQQPLVESRLRHCGILKGPRSTRPPSAGMSALDILAAASARGEKISEFLFPSDHSQKTRQPHENNDNEMRELWSAEKFSRFAKGQPTAKVGP